MTNTMTTPTARPRPDTAPRCANFPCNQPRVAGDDLCYRCRRAVAIGTPRDATDLWMDGHTDPMYGAVEVCRITGLTYRQVDYLARTNTIVPTVPAAGSGTKRLYSFHDVLAIAVWSRLRALFDKNAPGSLRADVAQAAMDAARSGDIIATVDIDDALMLTVDVDAIRTQVREAVADLPPTEGGPPYAHPR